MHVVTSETITNFARFIHPAPSTTSFAKEKRFARELRGTYPRNHIGVISAGTISEQLDAKIEWLRTFIVST